MSNPLEDPRVQVDEYIVVPSCYEELSKYERHNWVLSVTNGHEWGWSVRRGMSSSPFAMNRRGKWIVESRGNQGNRFRRFPVEEALELALKHVDTYKINGMTAQDFVDWCKKEKA